MTIQLSDCCKATIDLDKTKERPECYTCSKCGRIIGSPLSTHNTREGVEEWRAEFVKDFCEIKPYRNTEILYFKGFCDKNYNLIPTPKTIMQWFDDTLHHQLQKAREEERERIIYITKNIKDAFMSPLTERRWLQCIQFTDQPKPEDQSDPDQDKALQDNN